METESKLRLADVFVSVSDPRQAGKVEHDLVELLVVAVNAVLVGAGTFVEIELWAKEKLDCLAKPEQWPDLKSFAVIESERCINGKTPLEHRFSISSLPADA